MGPKLVQMSAYSLLLPLVVDVTEEVEHEEFTKAVEVELPVELVVLDPLVLDPEVDEETEVEDDDAGGGVRVT